MTVKRLRRRLWVWLTQPEIKHLLEDQLYYAQRAAYDQGERAQTLTATAAQATALYKSKMATVKYFQTEIAKLEKSNAA